MAAGLSGRGLIANHSSWEKLPFIVFGAVLLLVASLKISELNNYEEAMDRKISGCWATVHNCWWYFNDFAKYFK